MRDLRRRACRSRHGEAEGSLSWEVPGWVGAALTTPGRISIARWCGSGKRDEEEYARNQRQYVLRKVNRLQPGGYGPGVVRTRSFRRDGELSDRLVDVGPGGHGEVLRGSHGDATGTELGSSFIERITVNTGTVSTLARPRVSSAEGWAGSTVDRSGRDGAEPP